MENLRNRIRVQLVNNKKDYLKCVSKPSHMSRKIFDNFLVRLLILEITQPSLYCRTCFILFFQDIFNYSKIEYTKLVY